MTNPEQMNALVLAYAGDAVFELFVRNRLIEAHECGARKLHNMAKHRVCAAAQAVAMNAIEEHLTDVERGVYRRARNSKPNTMPKNADPNDYMLATAFEAVIGYLYLDGQTDRLEQLMTFAVTAQGEDHPGEPKAFRAFSK